MMFDRWGSQHGEMRLVVVRCCVLLHSISQLICYKCCTCNLNRKNYLDLRLNGFSQATMWSGFWLPWQCPCLLICVIYLKINVGQAVCAATVTHSQRSYETNALDTLLAGMSASEYNNEDQNPFRNPSISMIDSPTVPLGIASFVRLLICINREASSPACNPTACLPTL